jgi:hypothetical protein
MVGVFLAINRLRTSKRAESPAQPHDRIALSERITRHTHKARISVMRAPHGRHFGKYPNVSLLDNPVTE